MADVQPHKPVLLSDGKRMRLIWNTRDGNGEPSRHLVERCANTLKGHPTWKLFIGDIELPILRGSDSEPPHYVYLDDKACYTIWCTKAYTKDEMREFWPFDFDHLGNVKTGRKNRGRPAYSDEEETTYAKTPLRAKGKWYEYLGAPDVVTEYEPTRPKVESKMEKLVGKELTQKARRDGEASERSQYGESPDSRQTVFTTVGIPIDDTEDIYPSRPQPSRPMKFQGPTRPLPKSSLLLGIRPLNLSTHPIVDPAYGDTPASNFGITPQSLSGDLEHNSKRAGSEAVISQNEQLIQQMPPKRKSIQPFDVSSTGTIPSMPSPKRANIGLGSPIGTPSRTFSTSFGGDDANGDDGEYNEPLAMRSLRSQNARLETQLNVPREAVVQLQHDNEALAGHIKYVTDENRHLRAVIIQLLAANAAHQTDLSSRVIALQEASNGFRALGDKINRMAATAATEVVPTMRLSDGLGTILDGPGVYMYEHGLDEEWKALQAEADKLNMKSGDRPPRSQRRNWNFS